MLKKRQLKTWVQEIAQLTTPNHIHFCTGSDEEYRFLAQELVKKKTFIPLDPKKRPNSFLARSHSQDVARVEAKTFICSKTREEAGPTNNWRQPGAMRNKLIHLFARCMEGRTMYVIPFSMGPFGSEMSRIGVQITDSPYVVCSMKIMTRMGQKALNAMDEREDFVPCIHSVGAPLVGGEKDDRWPCNPKQTHIVHFPEKRSIWSFGSGYGGNALLGKKSFALRIASVMAKEEGWLAEHMLIVGVTNPEGRKKYFAGAFPSASGKTNLAMMKSALPGWKIECVGDDIAWMRFGNDGRLYAINPEAGFFGVATGTSMVTNPNAMRTCSKNSIFTNVALTSDGDVWWEGMTKTPPRNLIDWLGKKWTPDSGHPAAHPNSRFTSPAKQCPVIDPEWENPRGVPIAAILFGGRRSTVVPLVYEAFNWRHGVFLGCSVSSETTAAAVGKVGHLRHDPFAMLPFCGYNMADYFAHWLSMGKRSTPRKLPRIFTVNWFRKSPEGKYLWPGYGENARILKWIFERTDEVEHAKATPIGFVPKEGALDTSGLFLPEATLKELFRIDKKAWKEEAQKLRKYLSLFGSRLPIAISEELNRLETRVV